MNDTVSEIRLIIADDHPLMRQGLRQVIEAEPALKVIAEAPNGRVALEQIEKLRPAVAILDIDMPEIDGLSVGRELRARNISVEIIFLTVHREEEFFQEATEAGARGYVLKDSAISDIVNAIKAVSSGNHFVSPAMTAVLFNKSTPLKDRKSGINDLTPTERKVLKLIAEYKTSKEIAEALFISPRTVETHRTNICNKLDIRGRHLLMKFALDNKSRF